MIREQSKVNTFKGINYRCKCKTVYWVGSLSKKKCPGCNDEIDFAKIFDGGNLIIDGLEEKMNARPGGRTIDQATLTSYSKSEKKLQEYLSSISRTLGRIKPKNRRLEFVRERALVVLTLRDEYRLGWSEIGRIIQRDHSSVVNLYKRASVFL